MLPSFVVSSPVSPVPPSSPDPDAPPVEVSADVEPVDVESAGPDEPAEPEAEFRPRYAGLSTRHPVAAMTIAHIAVFFPTQTTLGPRTVVSTVAEWEKWGGPATFSLRGVTLAQTGAERVPPTRWTPGLRGEASGCR